MGIGEGKRHRRFFLACWEEISGIKRRHRGIARIGLPSTAFCAKGFIFVSLATWKARDVHVAWEAGPVCDDFPTFTLFTAWRWKDFILLCLIYSTRGGFLLIYPFIHHSR